MVKRILLTCVAFFLLGTLSGYAQSKGSLKVRTLNLGGGGMESVFLQSKDTYLPLQFSGRQFSLSYSANHQNPLPIFKEDSSVEESKYRSVAQVKLPADAKSILLLGWKEKEGYAFKALADNFESEGPNKWILVNTTKKEIAFQVGKENEPIVLNPGATKTYRVLSDKDRGVAATGVLKGEEKPFYSTYWAIRGGKRNVVLFLAKKEKVIVQKILDGGPPKKENE